MVRGIGGGGAPKAARAGLVAALMCATSVGLAVAAQSGPVAAQSAKFDFDIPAGPLNQALTAYGRQAGLQVTYLASIATGKSSTGFTGKATSGEALGRILAGSGLAYSFTNSTTIAIVAQQGETDGAALEEGATPLSPISVLGVNPNSTLGAPPAPYAGGQVATGGQLGMLGNRSVMDTPFSQTNYTNRTIRDQQARTVNEVLSNDPSILTTSIGVRNDAEFIRGFQNISTTATRSLNGLAGMAPIEFPSADYIDRVEVLKGPAALLNGMAAAGSGAIGGTINLTTKQAFDEPLTEITTRYLSDSMFGVHADVSRRFGQDGAFGVRINGSADGGDTPVDRQEAHNKAAAINLDYRGDRVRAAVDVAHQVQRDSPRTNFFTVRSVLGDFSFDVPKAPDADKSLFPDWDKGRSENTLGMARAEVDITENVTVYGAIGAQTAKKRFTIGGPAAFQSDGTYTLQPYQQKSDYDVLSMQGGVRATATTGPIGHQFNVSLSRAEFEEKSAFSVGTRSGGFPFDDPDFSGFDPDQPDPGKPRTVNETTVQSIGVADTLSFLDDRILFTAGVRYQEVKVNTWNATSGVAAPGYDSDAWSPAVGLVVKPWENVSVYASYIQGLNAGQTISELQYANPGVLPPFKSKQYEAGIKVDWGMVTTTFAAFEITQPNTTITPGVGDELSTIALDGEQRNRGVELNAYGEILEGVRLLGGVTFLDAVQTKTQGGTLDGERAYGAPKVRIVMGGEWDTPFIDGLTLTGRITYNSNQVVVNSRPDMKIPSWTTVDLGARYVLLSPANDKPITIRFNVDNVAGKNYWKNGFSNGFLSLGDPRTYRLSSTFTF